MPYRRTLFRPTAETVLDVVRDHLRSCLEFQCLTAQPYCLTNYSLHRLPPFQDDLGVIRLVAVVDLSNGHTFAAIRSVRLDGDDNDYQNAGIDLGRAVKRLWCEVIDKEIDS